MRENYRYILFIICVVLLIRTHAQDVSNFKSQPIVKLTGSWASSATAYAASGITARRVPFSWLTSANVNVNIKGFDLPFSCIITEQNRDFRQPFNQFGVSPSYKNLKLHLGWRNMQYSNYTLNSHTFFGAGIDYKIKKLSLSAMYGRFLKAVPEDSTKTIVNSGSQFPFAVYNRFGYSVKLGLGTNNNNISLIFLKAKDEVRSLPVRPVKSLVSPAENAVIGLKSKLSFMQHLKWELDGAVSVYTNDVRATDYPIENEELLQRLNKIVPVKLSSAVYYAGETFLAWIDKNYSVKLKYQRILPDFKSMGMYFIQTDVDRKVLEARWNDKKQIVSIDGSFGLENDNLTNRKIASTNRTIGSLNANFNPNSKFGISLSYMNYGTTQSPGLKSISDTVILDQVTNSIILTPRLTFTNTKMIHSTVLSISRQSLNDRNKFNSDNFEMEVFNTTLTYVLTLLSSNYSFDVSPFYVQSDIADGKSINLGTNLGVNKTFLKNKLNTSISASYSTNSFNNTNNGFTLQGRFNIGYRLDKHHRLQLQLTHVVNESISALVSRSFNEFTGTLQYVYSF
jgi:hypothetical protein